MNDRAGERHNPTCFQRSVRVQYKLRGRKEPKNSFIAINKEKKTRISLRDSTEIAELVYTFFVSALKSWTALFQFFVGGQGRNSRDKNKSNEKTEHFSEHYSGLSVFSTKNWVADKHFATLVGVLLPANLGERMKKWKGDKLLALWPLQNAIRLKNLINLRASVSCLSIASV